MDEALFSCKEILIFYPIEKTVLFLYDYRDNYFDVMN